jgi:hypothetical protein
MRCDNSVIQKNGREIEKVKKNETETEKTENENETKPNSNPKPKPNSEPEKKGGKEEENCTGSRNQHCITVPWQDALPESISPRMSHSLQTCESCRSLQCTSSTTRLFPHKVRTNNK